MSGSVQQFEEYHKEGLRAVPEERLLLETNSPYLRPKGAELKQEGGENSPMLLGEVAQLVGDIVRAESGVILRLTHHNAQTFFQSLLG
ncbi:hydrolase TatD [Elysia marginata]|uniref:Hydrolase TatD n=1 Tax=Elysia marginata TaxID=1093978 RepID=A0AAV4HT94_9GAST|nr:hydrolase TatD [Elysia marginata]